MDGSEAKGENEEKRSHIDDRANVQPLVGGMNDTSRTTEALLSSSAAERELIQRLLELGDGVDGSLPSTAASSDQIRAQQEQSDSTRPISMQHIEYRLPSPSDDAISSQTQMGGNLTLTGSENHDRRGMGLPSYAWLHTTDAASASEATMLQQPSHHDQDDYSNDDFDSFLSRLGDGYPSFEPSTATRMLNAQLNQPMEASTYSFFRAPSGTAMEPTNLPLEAQFTSLPCQSSSSTQALELEQKAEGCNYYQAQTSASSGIEDGMMPMTMQRSISPSNHGSNATDPATTLESNTIMPASTPTATSASSLATTALSGLSSSQSSSQDLASSAHFLSDGNHPTSLVIQSDATFLVPVHTFLRSACIELFVATQEHTKCSGRGARASRAGQVGLRCAFCKNLPHVELTRQAAAYPSKRDTIFESVRNYQRVVSHHNMLCTYYMRSDCSNALIDDASASS